MTQISPKEILCDNPGCGRTHPYKYPFPGGVYFRNLTALTGSTGKVLYFRSLFGCSAQCAEVIFKGVLATVENRPEKE